MALAAEAAGKTVAPSLRPARRSLAPRLRNNVIRSVEPRGEAAARALILWRDPSAAMAHRPVRRKTVVENEASKFESVVTVPVCHSNWLIVEPSRISVLWQIRTHDRKAISLFAAKRSVQMVSAEQFMHPGCLIPALDALG